MMEVYQYWSAEDDAKLLRQHGKAPIRKIAEDVGRSEQAVSNRIYRLGLVGQDPGMALEVLADKIRACAERGMTQSQTAVELGLSNSRICRAQQKLGIKLARRSYVPKPPIVSDEMIRACVAEGLNTYEAARKLRVGRETIRLAGKRAGVTFADHRAEHPSTLRYRQCAAEGMTARQIAEKFGVAISGVKRSAHRHGIVLPNEVKLPKHVPSVRVKLSPEQMAWVKATAPVGTSVAEFICAIVTDAYLDAVEVGV